MDISSIYTKQTSHLFALKGVCTASLKQKNRWIFVALNKTDATIAYAYCECPAGKTGTCSHAFAIMKLVAKWVIDKILNIPEPKACTSRPCAWSIPQSRNRVEKPPISDITLIAPMPKKKKDAEESSETSTTPSGIKSSLYDARIQSCRTNVQTNKINLQKLAEALSKIVFLFPC